MLLDPVHTPESVYFWNRKLFLYESASRPHEPREPCTLACVATVSARVRRESWDESKKRNDGRGEGERRRWPLLPSPSPFHFFFFRSRSNTIGNACHAGYLHIETAYLWNRSPGWVLFIRRVWRIHVDIFFYGLLVWRIHVDIFFLSDGFGEFMWIFFYPTGLANSWRTTS